MGRRKSYAGKDIEISFDMGLCIHARNCFLKLPQVFDPARRPWVDPDAAPAEEIAAMVRTCPSGALAFTRLDSGIEERPPRINRVEVRENGPLAFVGEMTIAGTPAQRATLCRCGKSANKPYCDYSHVDAGFAATGEPPAPEAAAPPETTAGPLEITPLPNGSLRVTGPIEVVSGTGRRLAQKDKVFFCRCGGSKNPPFCDGSHKTNGFTDQTG